MNLLNLNKRIEDKRRKDLEEKAGKMREKIHTMLNEEGLVLDAMPRVTADPVIRIMTPEEKKQYEEFKKAKEEEKLKKKDEGKNTKNSN